MLDNILGKIISGLKALQDRFDNLEREIDSRGKNVKRYGAKGDGITDDTAAIQTAINKSKDGELIYFPPGTYVVSRPINLLTRRTYTGSAKMTTIIKLKSDGNAPYIMGASDASEHTNIEIRNLRILGQRDLAGQEGIYFYALSHSTISNVRVENCTRNGFMFEGGDGNLNTTTIKLFQCESYANGGSGVFIGTGCVDVSIESGDYGNNNTAAIAIYGPSSSIKNATVWGTKNGPGVIMGDKSIQVVGCNLEGNATHGIMITANGDHAFIAANKIYDNSEFENKGVYDGINVTGFPDNIVTNGVIVANTIYSGLYKGTGIHQYSIYLNEYHENFLLTGNQISYKNNGEIDTVGITITGIKDGDIFNEVPRILSTNKPLNSLPGTIHFEVDTGLFVYYNALIQKWSTLAIDSAQTIGDMKSTDINMPVNTLLNESVIIPRGSDFYTVNLGNKLSNTNYTVTVTPTWMTSFFYTNKTSTSFQIHFSNAPVEDAILDWSVVIKK